MFKQLGQLASLMGNLPKIREEMERLQGRLALLTAEGDAGAGMVKVVVNGRMEMQSCRISEEAHRSGDREMLEELIQAATNQAVTKVRQLISEETTRTASGLGLPPGLGLPGLG